MAMVPRALRPHADRRTKCGARGDGGARTVAHRTTTRIPAGDAERRHVARTRGFKQVREGSWFCGSRPLQFAGLPHGENADGADVRTESGSISPAPRG